MVVLGGGAVSHERGTPTLDPVRVRMCQGTRGVEALVSCFLCLSSLFLASLSLSLSPLSLSLSRLSLALSLTSLSLSRLSLNLSLAARLGTRVSFRRP